MGPTLMSASSVVLWAGSPTLVNERQVASLAWRIVGLSISAPSANTINSTYLSITGRRTSREPIPGGQWVVLILTETTSMLMTNQPEM